MDVSLSNEGRMCLHCRKRVINRPRGLCMPCYVDPAIRDGYDVVLQRYRGGGNRGVGICQTGTYQLPAEPTDAQPGSPEKILVLRRRAEMGQALFHPLDATGNSLRVSWPALPLFPIRGRYARTQELDDISAREEYDGEDRDDL